MGRFGEFESPVRASQCSTFGTLGIAEGLRSGSETAQHGGYAMRIKFVVEKETKGAIRYSEVAESKLSEPFIGTLYIRKSGLQRLGYTDVPQTLTIEVPDNAG